MGTTYETPEEKQAIMADIKTTLAEKHGIEDIDNNTLLDELVKTEFSRRETQASFTKGQQKLKEVEAEKDFLFNKLQSDLDLSVAQDEELQKLKYEDPDQWMETLQKLKSQKKSEFDTTITEGLSHASSEASKNFALSRREEILKEFSEANPDINLTDSVVRDQLPPVLVNQLANGELAFGDFLEKAKKFIVAPKTTAAKVKEDIKDPVGKMNGVNKLPKDKVQKSIRDDYANMTF